MDYRQLAYQKAQKYGIDPELFVRQIQAESAFRPDAVSSAGAIGLGQLMPATAKELGVDPTDPDQNLEGAARYMKQLLGRYNNDPKLALAAYNAGMGNVDKAGGVPNFKETQNYVAKILGGEGGATMAQQPAQMMQEEKPQGLLGGLLSGQGLGQRIGMGQDFADKLAMAVMAGTGDARLQPLIAQRAASMQERKDEAKEQRQRNKSIEYLQSRADAGDAIAKEILGAVSTGALPIGTGISTYLSQALTAPQKPLTELAKIEADYKAGRLSPEQYKTAVEVFANKNKMGVRVGPDGSIELVQGGGLSKLTEAQSKDVNWASRMTGALEAFEPVADVLTSPTDKLFGLDPTGLSRYAQSGDYQKAEVAGLEFLAPLLRKDTGAAVTPKEWEFYSKIYIPTVGDQPEALAAKKAARKRALEALKLGIPPELVTRVQTVGGDPIAEAVNQGIIDSSKVEQQTPAQDGVSGNLTTPDFSTMSDDELKAWIAENG
jgi:hypothetical protein